MTMEADDGSRHLGALFTIALILFTVMLVKNGGELGGSVILVPVIAFGIWFAVSVALALLLYVTRHGRIVRVDQAVRKGPPVVLPERAGWSTQSG